MKKIAALAALLLLFSPAFAHEIYLRDVPEGHWAYDAVYDLIKRGVSGGYPDGTFRGPKYMSRYEMAAFLSKLQKSFAQKQARREKLIEELKTETALLIDRREIEQKESSLQFNLLTRFLYGETEAGRGGKLDYRLRTSFARDFTGGSALKINLDTMDAGFGGNRRDLLLDLLDFYGKLRLGGAVLEITQGPGEVEHFDSGLIPAEDKMYYLRPRRSVTLSGGAGNTSFALAEIARSTAESGALSFSELNAKLFQRLGSWQILLNPRILYAADGERDVRAEVGLNFSPGKLFENNLMLGLAKSENYPHGLLIREDLRIGNIKLSAQKIGSQYREQFYYRIFDLFNRDLPDGAQNIGAEIDLPLENLWFFKGKGSFTDPGSISTLQAVLGRKFSTYSSWQLVYLSQREKLFSQSLALQFSFSDEKL